MSGALLVIAPHPDDEILGAGGMLARARDDGGQVAIIIATDGSRSDPAYNPEALAATRRAECGAGLAAMLGEAPPMLFLGAPDGAFTSDWGELTAEPIAGFLAALIPETILVTDPADGHPDHKAAFGFATRLIAAGYGRKLMTMPISQRVDSLFDTRGYKEVPVGDYHTRKAAAIACHHSQIISETGFTLLPAVVADFVEREYVRHVFNREDHADDAIQPAHFDAMFNVSADPWRYDDEPYERDRFRRTHAALEGRSYTSALELGCANGALTEQIAPLCGHLLATDASLSALTAARKRVGKLPNVALEVALLPRQIPQGPFDLILASDMLYYLGLAGVLATLKELEMQATPDCRLLIASYLGETETRLTGEMASETAIANLPGWRRIHAERTDRLRIDVLERGCG